MDIIALLDQHSLDDIIEIEQQDRQFLALQDLRYSLVDLHTSTYCDLGTL